MKSEKLSQYRSSSLSIYDIRIVDSILCKLNENDLIIYLDNLKNNVPTIIIDHIKNNKQKGNHILTNFLKNKHGIIQIPMSSEYKDDITVKIYFSDLYENTYDDIINTFIKYLFKNEKIFLNCKKCEANITSTGIEYIFTTREYDVLIDLYSTHYIDICNRRSSVVKITSPYDNMNNDELIKLAEELSSKKLDHL